MTGDRVTWLGHATILLELSGARVLTDPVLRPRVAHLRRQVPPPAAPGPLDAVLISHLHRDHLDLPSLAQLDVREIVVPPGASAALRGARAPVVELAAGESRTVGAIEVEAVHATHDGRRVPVGPPRPAVGYVVHGDQRVYFAGDTEPFAEMTELAPLDLALLPVWGWGPSLGPGHMDPAEAAEAAALLRPAVAVPIHWGTYLRVGMGQRHGAALEDPPHRFAARVAERAPDTRVVVLAPGDALEL